jgi:hypothetical protein
MKSIKVWAAIVILLIPCSASSGFGTGFAVGYFSQQSAKNDCLEQVESLKKKIKELENKLEACQQENLKLKGCSND